MAQRHRSLTGCGGCRTRHLKCDEGRPGCQTCHLTGIACPGYNAQIKWPVDVNKVRGPASERPKESIFRRPLYQVIEQETMTKATVNSLGEITTNAALDNIEHWLESSSGPCLFQGPFGVLNFMHHHMSNEHAIDDAKPGGSKKENKSLAVSMNSVTDLSAMEQTSTHQQFSEPTPLSTVVSTVVSTGEDSFQDIFNFYSPTSPVRPPTQEPELSSVDVLPRALELLRHFKDNVCSFSFPLRGNPECPWQTIHLPAAMSTYAELLVSQKASHHRLSLFNSLVSASCLDRARRSRNTIDCEMYNQSQWHAKQHLELALKEEITSRKPVKYKELLVAILSMVYLEVFSGEYRFAQKFLIEAECLIRRRGFSKARKSFKVRILHHIYTWLRILAESTCGCALVAVCPARPNSSLVSDGELTQNLQSFRLPNAATLNELDKGVAKSDLIGYQDIHLEVMGLWNNSLFPIMYGIPESLMGLLSQVIRLANEQELFTRDTLVDVEVVTNLSKRTKKLEHHILTWELEQPPPPNSHHFVDSDSNGNSDRATPKAFCHNAFAMHQGLILFYYRRVHNINALILQETVQKALHFIEEACSTNQKEGQNLPLLWPCFIAACEAVDKSTQVRLLGWLRDMFYRTAVGTFLTAADVAQRVWKAREESSDFTLSWFDVMEHDRCPIIIV